MTLKKPRLMIVADHGLAIVYFLQTDVLATLLDGGVEVVVLTDDGLVEQIGRKFAQPGLSIEGMRLKQARQYFESQSHFTQYWLHFLRWMGGSDRVNCEAMNGHLRQMQYETSRGGKLIMPFIRLAVAVLRKSQTGPANAGQRPKPLHPGVVYRLVRSIPAVSGGRQHTGMAL